MTTIPSAHSYSTDIMQSFKTMYEKNRGIAVPSENTYIEGTNIYGKSFPQYKKYFGLPNQKGEIFFKDMTAE